MSLLLLIFQTRVENPNLHLDIIKMPVYMHMKQI